MLSTLVLAAGLTGGDLDWLRPVWTADEARLEVASRCWQRESDGQQLWLVGVAHVGEPAFYEALGTLMDTADTVVFESVLPEGAAPPTGADDETRTAATRKTAMLLGSLFAGGDSNEWNSRLQTMAAHSPRLVSVARSLPRDAWGRPWRIERTSEGPDAWQIRSLGADGMTGGAAAEDDVIAAIPAESVDADEAQLQRTMAESLGLVFQLDALPYGDPAWVPGDMTIDQVQEAFEAHGQRLEDLTDVMSTQSLVGGIANGVFRILPMLDALFGGRIMDTMRIVLIEMLSDDHMIEAALDMQGDAFKTVLLDLRNERAAEVTAEHLHHGSVALLYGAAHMPGLRDLLIDDQWTLCGEAWYPAITLRVSESALTPGEVDLLRGWAGSLGARFGQ